MTPSTPQWHERADWGARAPKPHPHFDPAKVQGVAIHWPGADLKADVLAGKPEAVTATLRSEQADHMDNRNYDDIAYNAAVDQSGSGWKLRWLLVRSGANDENSDANDRYLALTLLLNEGDHPSAAMVATAQDFIAKVQERYPNATEVVPHSDLSTDGTDCPGKTVRAVIADGKFTQGLDLGHTTITLPKEDDMNLDDRVDITNAVAKAAFPNLPSISVAGLLQYAAAYSRDAARDAAIARALAEKSASLGRALSHSEIEAVEEAAMKALSEAMAHAGTH